MSSDTLSRFHKFAAVVKDAIFLTTLIVGLSSAVGTVAVTWGWPIFIDKLQRDLNMVTQDDLVELKEQINKVTGEDRLIRLAPGHSYVVEPVSVGDRIGLILVMSRTIRGIPCNYLSATPLFTDARGIPFAGSALPPIKQLGASLERLHLSLDLPANLEPGRVSVSLGLRFSCPFGPGGDFIDAYDETDDIFFKLDPAPN